MSEKKTSYLQAREALLEHISTTLKQDRRFLAVWLAGSHARGEQQIATLRSLCDEMESIMPQVIALGGGVPASPRSVIEKRLALLE